MFIFLIFRITGYYSTHVTGKPSQQGRPSGSISCFYKPTLGQAKETRVTENAVIVKLENITIIGVYLRPQTTAEKMVECIVKILELVDPATPTIIVGDLNCRLDKPDRKCRVLLELMEEGIQIVNKANQPTYIGHNGTSTIDLILYHGDKITVKTHSVHLVHHQKASPCKGEVLATEQHRTGTQSRTKVDTEGSRRSILQQDT
ncbi:hypothetical protein ANN_22707 [Periplaneta americana]|uniref:Endonuclease/exonuclease/phosphatase domain-containing protein n=1 Tax=Periplaneta americana TaxID=6978 RepID=A0ABQ8S9R4_PERAM|nr:hypothetical protein ANN_22707 [Periplaneta americana]